MSIFRNESFINMLAEKYIKEPISKDTAFTIMS